MVSVDIELRKAAALINAGRSEAARSILSEYLNEFPESDLAWLLMSYVLDDPRKQQASATRAYRLNPENSKAKARIDQLIQFQAPPTPDISSSSFSDDFEKYIPENDSSLSTREQTSTSLSIEDRLAFVTLEAESSRGKFLDNYPAESIIANEIRNRERRLAARGPRKVSAKTLAGGGVIVTLLVAMTVILVKSFTGGFINKVDVEATASIETEIAWATNDARGRLPPTWTPTITPTLMHTSTPSPTPLPTATPMLNLINPTVEVEIDTLQQQVATLRELSILGSVETYMISRSKVRPIVESYYFSLEGSEAEIIDSSHVLIALGLIETTYDLLTNVLNSLIDNVGGFYLHETNELYVIGNRFTAIEKFIYTHEYDHALVDQNFDLNRLSLYPRCDGNEDRCKAIQALVEGDAMLLMIQWLEQGASASEYDEILDYRPPRRILLEQQPPPFASRNSEFPYSVGQVFVETLFSRGGWAGVNQAYSQLPESTEQILHPEKYFSREKPKEVPVVSLEPVLGDPWHLLRSNTLGEWLTYLILGYCKSPKAQLEEADAVRASEGWGGDHYQVYYNDDTDETVLVVQWVWDKQSDALEFADGMRSHLMMRFSEGPATGAQGECWQGEGQVACIYSTNLQTLWIIAPSIELLKSLEGLYPAFY